MHSYMGRTASLGLLAVLTHTVVSAKKSVGANVTGIGTRMDLLSYAREWVDKREWAVACFAALSGCALACAIARTVYDRSVTRQHAADARAAEFAKLQRSYLAVYVVIMLADWMQGTHMYTLYTAYAQEEGSSVSVGTLFFSGFLAAGVLGTFTGPLVDRYGRKRACLVYVALEVTINPPALTVTVTPNRFPQPQPSVPRACRAAGDDKPAGACERHALANGRAHPRRYLDISALLGVRGLDGDGASQARLPRGVARHHVRPLRRSGGRDKGRDEGRDEGRDKGRDEAGRHGGKAVSHDWLLPTHLFTPIPHTT